MNPSVEIKIGNIDIEPHASTNEKTSSFVSFQEMADSHEKIPRLKKALTEQALKIDELERELRTDELTSLPNSRAFKEDVAVIEQEEARGDGEPRVAAMLFLDFNNFKGVNDNLGQTKGDELLKFGANVLAETLETDEFTRSTSEMLATSVRISRGDKWYRIGGDEFAGIFQITRTLENAHLTQDEIIKITKSRILASILEKYGRKLISDLSSEDKEKGQLFLTEMVNEHEKLAGNLSDEERQAVLDKLTEGYRRLAEHLPDSDPRKFFAVKVLSASYDSRKDKIRDIYNKVSLKIAESDVGVDKLGSPYPVRTR